MADTKALVERLQAWLATPMPIASDEYGGLRDEFRAAIELLKECRTALTASQAAQQEPVAFGPPWKCGNEFLPYHPDASHCPPDYRDGWNACYRMALAAQSPAAQQEPVDESSTAPSGAQQERSNDDDREGPDRGQQGVQGASDGTGREPTGTHGAAGVVHDGALARRSASGGEGGRRLRFNDDWLRRQIEKYGDDIDPPSCPHGVMAGACPACAAAPSPAVQAPVEGQDARDAELWRVAQPLVRKVIRTVEEWDGPFNHPLWPLVTPIRDAIARESEQEGQQK